jgi:hypothetical protein
MTTAAYHAALHAALTSFALLPNPTGAGLCLRMVEWAQRDGAGADDREVAARFLRDVYECDGTAWDVVDASSWFENAENAGDYLMLKALFEESFS